MLRVYLMPLVAGIGTKPDERGRRPKYTHWHKDGGRECGWHCLPYGAEDFCLYSADVTDKEHDILVSDSLVYSFPETMGQKLSLMDVESIRNYLEANNIPADKVQEGMYFSSLISVVGQYCHLKNTISKKIFEPGVTLDSSVSDVSLDAKDSLQIAAIRLDTDPSDVKNSDTIRDVLNNLVDFSNEKVSLNGQIFDFVPVVVKEEVPVEVIAEVATSKIGLK